MVCPKNNTQLSRTRTPSLELMPFCALHNEDFQRASPLILLIVFAPCPYLPRPLISGMPPRNLLRPSRDGRPQVVVKVPRYGAGRSRSPTATWSQQPSPWVAWPGILASIGAMRILDLFLQAYPVNNLRSSQADTQLGAGDLQRTNSQAENISDLVSLFPRSTRFFIC
jgi:hypothetical protein